MVKAFRTLSKTETKRYHQLKEKLLEFSKNEHEITCAKFASFVGFSADSARLWLQVFEADGLVKLCRLRRAGERVYAIT
jgi:hypothetical protein